MKAIVIGMGVQGNKRKKYLYPRKEFTKIWCQFISRSEGAPIDESVDWNEVCSKPCNC